MEAYKKTLRIRAIAFALATIAAVTILVFGVWTGKMAPHDDPASGDGFSFSNYFAGFQGGILGASSTVFAALTVRTMLALKNENELKRRYTCEHDERNIFIQRASGGVLLQVCAIVILLAAMAAGYYNQYVFFSLLGCTMFLLLVKSATKLYYSRKY